MASKLWAYGKRLTLWGALVSSLPVLFFPLMFFSVLGIAFSVPLGCSVAIYVCFRKFYYSLFEEEVEVQKGLGLKGSEVSDVQESESQEEKSRILETTIHEVDVRPLGEETEKVKDCEDETQADWDPPAISSGEGEQTHEDLSRTEAQKCEGEAPLIEKLIPREETSEDEAQKDDAIESQLEKNWHPHEEADTFQWAVQKKQLDPLEEQAPEVENHKDEVGEAQLKEECDMHGEEEALQGQREAERDEEGQIQLEKKREPNGEGSSMEKIVAKDSALEDEAHYRVKDEEKVCGGESQLKWDLQDEEEVDGRLAGPQEENNRQDRAAEVETQSSLKKEVEVEVNSSEGEAQSDHSHGSTGEHIGTKHKRKEEQDVNNEKLYATDTAEVETQSSLKKEVEVNPSEGEAQSDHSHGSTGEHIGTKHKIKEEQHENDEKLYATDTKHKIREEEDKEQDESNKVKDIPHKTSRHEQSLNLAPSTTLYTKNASAEANMVTPEATPYAVQQYIQAESHLGASNLGVENGKPIEDNIAAGLPIPPSSEILGSSASESDEDSKSLTEGAVKEDTEDAEHIWEEIHALRNIIGYKEDPHPLYSEEIKVLFVLTGVEEPLSPKYSADLDRAKEKLKLLKLVYGIK